MVHLSAKTLALVVNAIKNLRETKGSTTREILNYISNVYNIPMDAARRQMQTVLKRGVAYGILKKKGAYYILPTDVDAECQEVAVQELGLLDLCRRRKQRKPTAKRRKPRGSRKGMCKCKKVRSRKRSRSRGRKRKSRRKYKCASLTKPQQKINKAGDWDWTKDLATSNESRNDNHLSQDRQVAEAY